jgi:hypothetical protein
MRILLRLILGLTVCFGSALIAAISGARVAQGRPADPALMHWFTRVDGTVCNLPCLFGVQPGRTSLQDAITAVRIHPITRGMTARIRRTNGLVMFGRDFTMGFTDQQIIYEVRVSHSDSALTNVHLILRALSLGAIVAELGAPDAFEFEQLGFGPGLRLCLFYDSLRTEICNLRGYQPGIRAGLADIPSYVAVHTQATYEAYRKKYGKRWFGFISLEQVGMRSAY